MQPEEWQPLFRRWHREAPERTRLHAWRQYGGQEVLALTVGPPPALARPGSGPSVRLLAAVPHAHEPAPTAAAVDVACQLLTGAHLDGSPAALPAWPAGGEPLVTLLPDANPQGRARSPTRCWDGRAYDNEAFLGYAFGLAADGRRFPRLPEWRWSAERPLRAGIAFEQVDADLWVEPNTSRRSTYSRALDELCPLWRHTHLLDMHQHEAPEAVLLPEDFDAAPDAARTAIGAWSDAVLAAWREAGGAPQPRPYVPYQGQPRQQQFRAFWGDRFPWMLRLTSEVRNNRLQGEGGQPAPLEWQFRMAHAALVGTLRHLTAAGR